MTTEQYIRDCAARGFSKTMVMEALGVSRSSFKAMLDLMPPIQWPAAGQSLACQQSYASRRGVSTPKLRAAGEKGRQAKREKHKRTVGGVTATISELADLYGVCAATVRRLMTKGKSLEEALQASPKRGPKKVNLA